MLRKRITAGIFAGIIMLSSLFAGYPISDRSLNTVKTATASQKWPDGPSKKSLASGGAILMELSTGTILYQKNIQKEYYPASITKIMTTLLALENSSLEETVTFSEKAVYGIEAGSSTIYSEVDEKMTMEQCLYAIMLESANEVCLAVGEHIAGSQKKFVNMMNEKVAQLGLKHTHFNNPNGLPDPDHYTSPYDMAIIAREAMKHTDFKRISNTKSYVCAKTNKHKMKRTWFNHHQMVSGNRNPEYLYKYCTGGKTGYTNAAGNTLVTYAEKDGMQLVCVVMKSTSQMSGSPNQYSDTIKLLNFGFEKFCKFSVQNEIADLSEDLFNNYGSFFNVKESPVRMAEGSMVVLPKNVDITNAKQTISYHDGVTIQEGDNVIGHVTYTYGKRTIGSSDILYTYNQNNSARLDESSRDMVEDQIEDIEQSNSAKHKKVSKKITKRIANAFHKVGDIFDNRMLGSIIIIVSALVVILIIALLLHGLNSNKRRRRRRRTGGYQSRRGQKNHKRERRRNRQSSGKQKRRNHSRKYVSGTKKTEKKQKRSRSKNYSKRRKNTKESFGKNFFDF